MKRSIILLFLIFAINAYGQIDTLSLYNKADSLMKKKNYSAAYQILKAIEPSVKKADVLSKKIISHYIVAITLMEKRERLSEKWDSSLFYGQEGLRIIQLWKPFFEIEFTEREFWMHKNLIVTYFGLNQIEKAQVHKELLYKAYKKKKLPNGIDICYNFSYFKWRDKNIWGYEFYPEIGDKEVEDRYTKIIYLIYSTKPDGSDDKQLYRFHVIKYHRLEDSNQKYDYVLERQRDTETERLWGSFYKYTYQKKINYIKLKKDIVEILETNSPPNVERRIKRDNSQKSINFQLAE